MSGGLNRVILIGHLDDKPEIMTTDDGKEAASFAVATSEEWTDKITGKKKQITHLILLIMTLIYKNFNNFREKK